MKPHAYIVHRVPGRVRLKVPGRRGNHAFFAELQRRLQRLDGVTEVKADPVTGSVLLEHKDEIGDLSKEIFGGEAGELVEFALGLPPVARRLGAEIGSLDTAVRRFSDGEVDLGTLASLGLLALAMIQLVRGGPMTHAVSLGWYATELLRRSGSA